MSDDWNPDERLPSLHRDRLREAVGERLLDVERWITVPVDGFVEDGRFGAEEFFARSSGMTRLHFSSDVVHSLDVHGEQLSIMLLPEPATGDEFESAYHLSSCADASPALRSLLGRTCTDVRIWRYHDGVPSDEAREAAVSYRFDDGSELFYCIYFHGDLDTDYLLVGPTMRAAEIGAVSSVLPDDGRG